MPNPARGRILPSLLLLCLAVLPLGAWTLFEDFESHNWYNAYWADWFRWGTATYGAWQGRDCVKLTGPTDKGAQALITNFFADENWSNVESVKVDIYPETAAAAPVVKLELFSQNDAAVVTTEVKNLSTTPAWTTYTWNYAVPASPGVAKLHIIFDTLGANAATFYVDNLRLVLQDGTTHQWDDFNDQGRIWSIAGSTAVWTTAAGRNPEFVSHNASTSTANGGAALLWWDYTGPPQAELLPTGVNVDWRAKNALRADVRCSDPAAPVKFFLWYGGWGQETEARYVTAADTWQTLYWPLPDGATNNNIQGLNPRVLTSGLTPHGTFYIDNIYAGDVRVSVVKSTGAASARPGDTFTCTLTYGNAGADAATGLIISDVVPFNGSIAEAAAAGSADGVEYYVGASWTSSYDASATKVRWKDAAVPAGSSGLAVSYKVKVR